MIKPLISFVVISLISSSGAVAAADPAWYPIGYEAAVDLSSIRKVGNVSRVWTMSIMMETDSKGIDYTLNRYEIDCSDRTVVRISRADYSLDGIVNSPRDNRTEKFSIPPGTVMSAIADVACDNDYDLDFSPIDDAGKFVEIVREVARSDVSRH